MIALLVSLVPVLLWACSITDLKCQGVMCSSGSSRGPGKHKYAKNSLPEVQSEFLDHSCIRNWAVSTPQHTARLSG